MRLGSAARTALAAAAAAAGALLLAWSPAGSTADRQVYDLLSRLRDPPPAADRPLILAIDETSLERIGGVMNLRRPLARALETLAAHEPAAVAIDLVLSEPRDDASNEALRRALAASPRTVLAANLRADGTGWELPRAEFADKAAALGHAHAEADPDGVCRRVPLAKAAGRRRLWALSLEAYRLARGGPEIVEEPGALRLADRVIPVRGDAAELLVRFAGPSAPIEILPLARLLDDPASAAVARGRTVFVGVRVLGGIDRYLMTPQSRGQPMAGVEINANVYETLARGDFLVPPRASSSLALALTLAAAAAWAFAALGGWAAAAVAAAASAAALAAPWLLFRAGFAAPFAELVFPAGAAFVAGAAVRYRTLGSRLEAAEAERGRYRRAVHYISHEMRTPLTALQGSGELIGKYDLPEERRRAVGELIHRESARLARMIELFLGVERIAAGELEIRRERVDAEALTAESIERVRPAAEKKRIAIERRIEGRPAILGDPEFLEYACYNLLSNAVKYSPAETAIEVRVASRGGNVVVSVRDRGYGMDSSELERIFRRFYRSEAARRSGEPGSGLGLALVEEIVVRHGGAIEVESEPGKGSCFTMSLPSAGEAAER